MCDERSIIGRFMAFDRHLNLVLGDSEEYRKFHNNKGINNFSVRIDGFWV